MINILQTKKWVAKTILPTISSFLVAVIGVGATVSAWGPERTTYTNDAPAPYATFNSITDNAAVGDERNFVRIREAGTDQNFRDEIEIEPGKEYEVYIYYHNNAASNTNASGLGMATNTRVSSAYPTIVNSGERGMVSGIISWSYVTPEDPNHAQTGKVWDEAYVTTNTDGTILRYKTGSAVIHNSGDANGAVLPTALFTEDGTPIGFNKLEGNLPGCAEYSGHITYTLVAEQTAADLDKQVSLDGENWSDSVTAHPGQIVTYKVTFKNTGNTELTNVIFKDTHDEGLSLYSGSTKVFDVDNTDGKQIDDILDLSGYNVGNVAPGALVQIIYQARINDESAICSKTLNNTISINYNSTDQGSDSAAITVACEEDCTTNPNLPGCQEKNCKTNPEMEGCQALPNTGPVEIVLAIIIVLGIGGGGYYLYRTRKTLNKVESVAKGDSGNGSRGQQQNG
ncbi:isopeptide-forming domain-containing fimbrial protein [Candidatus Saccharibacteria bacterium]|nr:isopeptide-forming domain-containing fimbrial protein [Candidatus Saccharibacteria bacterium]